MAILPENLDFTDKDFDSIVARLNNLLVQAFPDWTDLQVSNFGNTLKELFAYTCDILIFYQDNQAKESRLTDVELRKNAIALAKMLGFAAAGASAATADVLVALDVVPANDVVFEDGQIVRTKDITGAVEFQMLGGLTIPALADPPQAFVTVENSENLDEDFQSNTLPDQEFILSGIPFLDDSLIIIAANGAYTQVDNFLSSTSVDRHFTVAVDEDDRATVRFGSGVNGEIPVGVIQAAYKTGGGSAGNVEANTITVINGLFTDTLGSPVQVTVNNPVRASGGDDRQNVEQIKLRAPESVRVSDRTVSLEDYTIGADAVSGVSRSLMLTSDQNAGIAENRGVLYVIPDGGGTPTQTLKDAVLIAVTVTKPNTVTFKVDVVDPIFATIDIAATVFKSNGFTTATVGANVRAALDAFFALENADGTPNENIGFGFSGKKFDGTPANEIPLMGTLLADILKTSVGVRKLGAGNQDFTINGSHEDFPLQLFEFPILGTVTLIDGDTGGPM